VIDPSTLREQVERIAAWASGGAAAAIERWEPQRLPAVRELCAGLRRFGSPERTELAICFLGNSGVGKSTLINSVIDPRLQVVPQGGIGPLTAQATVVRHATQPYLHATYHGAGRINQLTFALDRHWERQRGIAHPPAADLDPAELRELELALSPDDAAAAGTTLHERMRSYISQAKQLITGRQFGDDELPIDYLADCLRAARQRAPRWGYAPLPEHAPPVAQLADAIALGDRGRRWEPDGDPRNLLGEVARHASGSIAPLIKSLEVGWPAEALRDGLVLVDLPGIGIANDEYRSVTSAWIRRAAAVVLVVDKSGVTEASADLLRTTGFLNSILHREPDSTAVSPLLRVVAVKLDDVATAERQAFRAQNPGLAPPPWLAAFRSACDRSQELIRNQLAQVFDQSVGDAPPETQDARRAALVQTAAAMAVYPVSAIEYRKLHEADPEDPAKIKAAEDSGIPALIDSLRELARCHHRELIAAYQSTAQRLFEAIARALARVDEERSGDARQQARLVEQRRSLDAALAPAAGELRPRLGMLRERLRGTIPQTIDTEVERGVAIADRKVREYFLGLREVSWRTLRAAIHRGGVWVKTRPIDLPNELALRFEEPLAVAWNRGAVAPLRRALHEFGRDLGRLLGQAVVWARGLGDLDAARVQRFEAEAEAEVRNVIDSGDLAAADLTKFARQLLHASLQDEIGAACQVFVDDGLDVGAGVMRRMHQFLDQDLAPRIAEVARTTALQFFRTSYDVALSQVAGGLSRFSDPQAYTGALLLGDHERALRSAGPELGELERVRRILDELAALRDEAGGITISAFRDRVVERV
jgi:GTP-binding protein EngB required for normal cell division